jgi:hypothetical protein
MTKWQAIESAPKDGTEIDLWGRLNGEMPSRDERITDCKWLHDANGPGWNTRGDQGWESLCAIQWKPSHWMPRPSPPTP